MPIDEQTQIDVGLPVPERQPPLGAWEGQVQTATKDSFDPLVSHLDFWHQYFTSTYKLKKHSMSMITLVIPMALT